MVPTPSNAHGVHTFPSAVGRQLFKAEGNPPDAQAASQETTEAGELAGSAAKILMKILHAARLARWDVLRAVNHLACFFTKWTTECDRKLHRLVSYLNETKHVKMIGWVADDLKGLSLDLFADADSAGCIFTTVYIWCLPMLEGPQHMLRAFLHFETTRLCQPINSRG